MRAAWYTWADRPSDSACEHLLDGCHRQEQSVRHREKLDKTVLSIEAGGVLILCIDHDGIRSNLPAIEESPMESVHQKKGAQISAAKRGAYSKPSQQRGWNFRISG